MVLSSRTQEDAPAAKGGAVAFLTYVLSYDDLLAERDGIYPLSALGRPLQIGRADHAESAGLVPGAGLRLLDRFLSSAHAEVAESGAGHVLRDLGSRNGTYVNGVRVSERALCNGDLIEVGHTLLCYRQVAERTYEHFQAILSAGGARLGPTRTLCPEVVLLVRDLTRVAPSREAVLILAETGAGKEVAAQAVHDLSGRPGGLCAVDCGAVPESLFESTFFGHRRGSYTGATGDQIGLIARAHTGTLFLDEVANMSQPAQAKLLRVIEEGRVRPLGAAGPQVVDVRWMAATNADLYAEGAGFRGDLLQRLAGYVARIPPLRRRREDLGVLTAYLLREAGARRASIGAVAGRRFFSGVFPGNIRQLRSVLRGAVLLAADGTIEAEHLGAPEQGGGPRPGRSGAGDDGGRGAQQGPGETPKEPRRGTPTQHEVEEALQRTHGNMVRAAAQLGVHVRQLYRLVERYGLPRDRYR